MRTLADLLTTADGVALLEAGGAYTTPDGFRAHLRPPSDPALRTVFGAEAPLLVCAFQQIYVDYHWSVLRKILALRDLARAPDLASCWLWLDTDRAGSDRLHTTPAWPPSMGRLATRPQSEDRELRYVPLDPAQVERMLQQLQTQLAALPDRRRTGPKYRALQQVCRPAGLVTLADFNHHLTAFLLDAALSYVPPARRLADLLPGGLLLAPIDHFLNHLPRVVAVFNATIAALAARDVDPQVVPIADDYLPLNYSCPVDDRRLRLQHRCEYGDHFAVARCHCGAEYRFYLGRRTLSMTTLAATQRWSPTVCLPIFLTPLISGLVVSRSSALYGLVLNAVLRQALDWPPLPMYIPPGLAATGAAATPPDSLLYHYFYG